MNYQVFINLKRLRQKATPGVLNLRDHPQFGPFVEARTYEGHPYHGVTNGGFGILEDEDYPTKRADAEFIVTLWNAFENGDI